MKSQIAEFEGMLASSVANDATYRSMLTDKDEALAKQRRALCAETDEALSKLSEVQQSARAEIARLTAALAEAKAEIARLRERFSR